MVYNSGLGCGTADNMGYGSQGATAVRPHGPKSICGVAVTYDANGNTLTYDGDGAGPVQPRSLTYDLENRPASVRLGTAVASTFGYGPDGERVRQVGPSGAATWYVSNDAEISPLGVTSQRT